MNLTYVSDVTSAGGEGMMEGLGKLCLASATKLLRAPYSRPKVRAIRPPSTRAPVLAPWVTPYCVFGCGVGCDAAAPRALLYGLGGVAGFEVSITRGKGGRV